MSLNLTNERQKHFVLTTTILKSIKNAFTMGKIDLKKTYTKEEALAAVPILNAMDVPTVMSGSELQRIALHVALMKFNEKKGGAK